MEIQEVCAGLEKTNTKPKRNGFFLSCKQNQILSFSPDFDKQSASKAWKYFAE
jgi:hypothetical protein